MYKNTSLSCTLSSICFYLLTVISCSISCYVFWYTFCISLIWLSTRIFPFLLHLFNSLANRDCIWYAWFSMFSWIIFYRFSDIPDISPTIYVLYVSLTCNIVILIFANWVFATSANLTIFCNCNWISAIVSISHMILWYFLV